MSLHRHYDILTIVILMSLVFASSQSKIPLNNTTNTSEKKPLTRNTTPVHLPQPNTTTTDRTILPSSTSTIQFNQTTTESKNTSPTTTAQSRELFQTTQTTEGAKSSSTSSTMESNAPEKTRDSSSSKMLAVSLSLGFCLLAVGVAAAVFFVRWKRIKKMKQGFQEEMAVICLHDELASEALYCSWKPFMDGNENNKIKLVIEASTSDANTSRANT